MRGFLAELHRRQPVLAWAGWAMLAWLALCLLAMALDGRQIGGTSVWTKPAKFAASLLPWFWTLAWAWGLLAPAARRGALAWLVLGGTLAAAALEMVWITGRGAAGLPSHFATDPIGQAMFGVMGAAATLLVLMAGLLGVLVLARGEAAQPRPWRLAVGLGLVVTGVLGLVTGFAIGGAGSPLVGAATPGLPPFFWSRDGGDLRVAHFLAVHAMQAVPGFWLLTRAGPRLVALATLGWGGLALGALRLAQAGVPLSP
ncbi:hypothetical protein [Falsiroseomonas selenitidurans]|uniref:Uncharacterized protein n=1 Tax=Falsiroseomonas selenitidurans TaxID=2716335 RepID=A0ABX1E5B9_9PROT|nr:hypothetical protein [Falsiroseomonas selenitidurans]NKC32387.1 hypothetical protein [Falsiroseomonas selenitidurans]